MASLTTSPLLNSGQLGTQIPPMELGDATWLHRSYSSTLWTTAGGDFVITASATTTIDGVELYSWSAPGMVADIQDWLDTPATNHGWILIGGESLAATAKRFNSRENTLETRPLLIITSFVPSSQIYLPLISR